MQLKKINNNNNTFLVLNFCLDIVDGVAALDLESDGFPS